MLRSVEDHQRLAFYRRVALDHLHVAGEGRHLILVAHFERRGFNLDRLILILVLNDTLAGGRCSAVRTLRRGRSRRRKCHNHSPERKPPRHRSLTCVESWSGCIVIATPPLNRITSPLSETSICLALMTPLTSFTQTGFSDT